MHLFVWENVSLITTSWHDGGGLLVIAPSLDQAREIIRKKCPEGCEALTAEPALTCQVDHYESLLMLFPDAGCC
jgi:hypothetical protein